MRKPFRKEREPFTKYEENDFIFKWPNGTPLSPDYVSSHFSLLLKNNHLPHIRFHELRHSCASLLLNNGFTLKDVLFRSSFQNRKFSANDAVRRDLSRNPQKGNKALLCVKKIAQSRALFSMLPAK